MLIYPSSIGLNRTIGLIHSITSPQIHICSPVGSTKLTGSLTAYRHKLRSPPPNLTGSSVSHLPHSSSRILHPNSALPAASRCPPQAPPNRKGVGFVPVLVCSSPYGK